LNKPLLTVGELSTLLNVPDSWVYDRTRLGGPEKLPHYKIGKYVRFSETEVLDYLSEKARNSKSGK